MRDKKQYWHKSLIAYENPESPKTKEVLGMIAEIIIETASPITPADLNIVKMDVTFRAWMDSDEFAGNLADKRSFMREYSLLPVNPFFVVHSAEVRAVLEAAKNYLNMPDNFTVSPVRIDFLDKIFAVEGENIQRNQQTVRATKGPKQFNSLVLNNTDIQNLHDAIWSFGQANSVFLKRFS